MWEQAFKEELEKISKKKKSWMGLPLGMTAGMVSSVLTHPIEHSLYGNPKAPLKNPFTGKVIKWKNKLFVPNTMKKKFLSHLGFRLPKAMLASAAAFGTYHLLDKYFKE